MNERIDAIHWSHRTCKACKFMVRGECYCHPPTVIMLAGGATYSTVRPHVSMTTPVCGEFEKRAKE